MKIVVVNSVESSRPSLDPAFVVLVLVFLDTDAPGLAVGFGSPGFANILLLS